LARKAQDNLTKLNNRTSVEISSFGALKREHGLTVFAQYDLDQSSFPHPLMSLTLSDGEGSIFTSIEDLKQNQEILNYLASSEVKIGYDVKRIQHGSHAVKLTIDALNEDLMILAFLTDSNQSSFEKTAAVYGWPSLPAANRELSTIEACKELAVHMHQTYLKLKGILEEKGMAELYRNIEIPIVDVLVEMEHEGIRVDLNILNRIADETLIKINGLSAAIISDAGVDFNLNSPKQLAEILFDKLNLPANKKRSTSIDILEELAGSHAIIAKLIEYRKYSKLYSTYAQGLKKFIQSDGKIHTDYKQCVAATGRLSSSDPNLQNISIRNEETREIRKAFVADEGYILYSCDYSQIELRILAHMANETAMIEAFTQGEDIHTHTARDVFMVEEPNAAQRRQAKAVNFGIIYGISDFGLAQQIGVSRETARKFIQNYLNTYRQIQNFMDETIAFCQINGYVTTMFGRRREIPEIHDRNYAMREFGKRAAMNAPIQGSAADLIKVAMIKIHAALRQRGLKTKMILQVHDELVFHVLKSELDEVRSLVKSEMSTAAVLNVPLDVSEAWGADWYEAK
jgi:DNA polymerase-1